MLSEELLPYGPSLFSEQLSTANYLLTLVRVRQRRAIQPTSWRAASEIHQKHLVLRGVE